MITLATVVDQRESAVKKGMYITVLKERFGELKAYTARKLEVGQEVVISVRPDAIGSPLSVTVLSKKQEDEWKAQNPKSS